MSPPHDIENYYVALVRLVASQMVDPHRYFEQKLVGEMQVAQDATARSALLSRLLQWLDDGLLTPAQRVRVNARLEDAGLPDTDRVRRSPGVLRGFDSGP